ncbi:MAG: hypothetical protein EGQ57_04985 [Alphaproteobacteria bacterium]|jgi:hypothetical protein|nr:hypothetical protein [Alphaproteobacteria bacterium]HIV08269.1 hypothetical protein [Candidatus Scatocola faecigallinarum]
MKANVANYIIQEMSSRFPMRSEDVVNADLIDAVIDDWSNNRFKAYGKDFKFHSERLSPEKYLM